MSDPPPPHQRGSTVLYERQRHALDALEVTVVACCGVNGECAHAMSGLSFFFSESSYDLTPPPKKFSFKWSLIVAHSLLLLQLFPWSLQA